MSRRPLLVLSLVFGYGCATARPPQKLTLAPPVPKDAPAADRLAYLEAAQLNVRTRAERVVMRHVVVVPAAHLAFVARSPTYVDVVDLEVGGTKVSDARALIPYVASDSSTAKQARMAHEVADAIVAHGNWGLGLLGAGLAMVAGGIALGASADPRSAQFDIGVWTAVGGLAPMIASLFAFTTAPPASQPYRSEMNAMGSFPSDFEANLGLCRTGEHRDRIVPCELASSSSP